MQFYFRPFVHQRCPKCSPLSFTAGLMRFSGCLRTWISGVFLPALYPLLCSRALADGNNSDFIGTKAAEVLSGILCKWGLGGRGINQWTADFQLLLIISWITANPYLTSGMVTGTVQLPLYFTDD